MRNIATLALLGAILAAAPAHPADMTAADYRAARERIAAEYQASRQKCGSRHGNAADQCIARAHGAQAVARAELEAIHTPGPRANYAAAIARAQAGYANAREECDDKDGAAREACVCEAAAEQDRARAEARLR
jgi:hypothetical protein